MSCLVDLLVLLSTSLPFPMRLKHSIYTGLFHFLLNCCDVLFHMCMVHVCSKAKSSGSFTYLTSQIYFNKYVLSVTEMPSTSDR